MSWSFLNSPFIFTQTTWKWKFSLDFIKFLKTCVLGIGGHVPCTIFWPSWRGRDEIKVKVLSPNLYFYVNFSMNISAWYGLEGESTRDDSINSYFQAFLLQSENIKQTSCDELQVSELGSSLDLALAPHSMPASTRLKNCQMLWPLILQYT